MKLDNLTFKGGVNVPHYKGLTEKLALEKALDPEIVNIPLHQHTGAPCEPLVKVGEMVRLAKLDNRSICISTSSFVCI